MNCYDSESHASCLHVVESSNVQFVDELLCAGETFNRIAQVIVSFWLFRYPSSNGWQDVFQVAIIERAKPIVGLGKLENEKFATWTQATEDVLEALISVLKVSNAKCYRDGIY